MKRIFSTLAVALLALGVRAQDIAPDSISLHGEIQKVEVVATRATRLTPIAHTNG